MKHKASSDIGRERIALAQKKRLRKAQGALVGKNSKYNLRFL